MSVDVSPAAHKPGLFGKLPAKRDFVAVNVPANVLRPLETWLQTAMAVSRQAMGQDWQAAYLSAPIWRFWLGRDVCGQAVLGVLMPSMDGVGRYFPLLALVVAPSGRVFPTPIANRQDDSLAAIEEFLLSALDGEADYAALLLALDGLVMPTDEDVAAETPWQEGPGGLAASTTSSVGGLPAALATVRAGRTAAVMAGSSFWWTLGGEGFAPRALAAPGFPDPAAFARFLTGET